MEHSTAPTGRGTFFSQTPSRKANTLALALNQVFLFLFVSLRFSFNSLFIQFSILISLEKKTALYYSQIRKPQNRSHFDFCLTHCFPRSPVLHKLMTVATEPAQLGSAETLR
jgi:hypothetical protein